MSKQVKLSELKEYAYIGHEGEVITKAKALELLMKGEAGAMVAVNDEYIQDVLTQIYNDVNEGIDKELYSSKLPCDPVVVDYLPKEIKFTGDASDLFDYFDLTTDKTYKTVFNDDMDVNIFRDSGVLVVMDDANDEHEILLGDYDILSLITEEEVNKTWK